ncbi:MAG TPA: TolC family protein, partial [Puia sp.]|nr:TolC family protein [Puia sp.]
MVLSQKSALFTPINKRTASVLIFFLLVTMIPASSQTVAISIRDVLERVQKNLPQLEAFRQQAAATQREIQLSKNTLMPELTAGYQVNMATINNITGMIYPGFVVPMTGPPSTTNELNFLPGSALGALVKWNPISFGQRAALIDKANAQFKQATAVYSEQLFRYQYSAINIYLEAVYYKQLLKSVEAAIERNEIGLEQSMVLAKNGLRPGIDTAQFQSAIAQSEIDLLQTEKIYLQELTELSRLTGIESSAENILLTDTAFNQSIHLPVDASSTVIQHPYYLSLEAQKNTTASGLKEIQKSWVPQLDIWGNVYARGSGVDATGHIDKADGFNLSRTNVGVGLQLSFPVLAFSRVNIKKKQYQS